MNSTGTTVALKRLVLRLARALGLFALCRRLTAKRVRILGYHGIWLGAGHFGNYLFISEATFARRLAHLARKGYPVISLEDAVKGLKTGHLPAGATVITIDDGWYGSYRNMLPLLHAYRFPATVYLTTYHCLNQTPVSDVMVQYWWEALDPIRCPEIRLPDSGLAPLAVDSPASREHARRRIAEHLGQLGNDTERQAFVQQLFEHAGLDYRALMRGRVFHLMSPREVRRADAAGVDFELHTHRHRTASEGRDCLAQELGENRDHLWELVGRKGQHFCYPSGEYSPDQWPVLQKAGIVTATTTETGLVDTGTQPYAMPRILDGENVSDIEFEAELAGFLQIKRDIVGGLRRLVAFGRSGFSVPREVSPG